MSDLRYGRLFTEVDVGRLLQWACSPGEQVSLQEALDRVKVANQGDDPSRFPADEPLMLLRAQSCPIAVLEAYKTEVDANGSPREHLEIVDANIDAFTAYQQAHGRKIAD